MSAGALTSNGEINKAAGISEQAATLRRDHPKKTTRFKPMPFLTERSNAYKKPDVEPSHLTMNGFLQRQPSNSNPLTHLNRNRQMPNL